VIGLEERICCGHARTLTAARAKVNSGTSYFLPPAAAVTDRGAVDTVPP
jgi:hypothetical protein